MKDKQSYYGKSINDLENTMAQVVLNVNQAKQELQTWKCKVNSFLFNCHFFLNNTYYLL
jgi:hypothetical protein